MTASYYMRGKKNSLAGSGRGAGHSSSEDADRGAMAGGGMLDGSSSSTGNSSSSTPASFSGAGGHASGGSTGDSDVKIEIDSSSTSSSSRKRKRGTDTSDVENEQITPGDSNGPDDKTPENYPSIDADGMPKLLAVIEKEFSLEILLKNQERKTIEAEKAKVEVSIKQLEQCVVAGDGAYHESPNRYHNYYGHFLEYGRHSQHNGGLAVASSSSRPQRNAAMKAAARSNSVGHVCLAKNDKGKVVRVTCPDCNRYDFSNVQGFINHCRIAHKIEYASHDDAVRHCGVEVDLSEFGTDEATRPPTHMTRPGIQSILNTSSTLSGKLPETAREHPPPTYNPGFAAPPLPIPSATPSFTSNVSPHKRKLSTTSFDDESSYGDFKAFNDFVASPVTTRARAQSFSAIIRNSDLHSALASGNSYPFTRPVIYNTRRNSVSGPSQKNTAATSHSKRHRLSTTRRSTENGMPSTSETESATPILKHLHKFTSGTLDYDIDGFVEEMRRDKHNMMFFGDDLSISGDSDSDEKVENMKKPNSGVRRPTGAHRTPTNYAPPIAGLVEVPATRSRNRQQKEKERLAREAKEKSEATSSGQASSETTPTPKAPEEKKEDDIVDITTTSDTSTASHNRAVVLARRRQSSKPLKKSPMEEQSFLSTLPLRTKNRRRRTATNTSILPPISTDIIVKKEDDALDSDETSSDDEPGRLLQATSGVDGTMTPTSRNAGTGFVGPSCGKDAPNVQYVSPTKEKQPLLLARPDLVDGSRYYVKRRIKIGNTSKFIPEAKRSPKMSKYTHKWMIYFVSPPYSAPSSTFLSSVTIFLDESFPLPRVIELRVPPFRWVSYGWGEFNLNIRLTFCDPVKNKPMDVVHPLRLDPGRTGREVIGYEGYFDVELDRNSQFLPGEPGVEYDEIPKMAEVEKAEDNNPSAQRTGKMKVREEELDADTIRVVHIRDMITIAHPPAIAVMNRPAGAGDKRPILPKNPSFKSDDNVVEKASEIDDAEIRQIIDKVEPYSFKLHQAAKKYPLVSASAGKSPYSIAPSNQVFLSWNLGRQKSVEWHRARLMESDVLANLNGSDHEVAESILTTKRIMFWCRRNQYGPPDSSDSAVNGEKDLKYCRFCGMIADSPPQKGQKRTKSSYGVDAYCRCGQNVADSLAGLKTASSVQDMITRNRGVRRRRSGSPTVISIKPAEVRALLLQTDVNLLRWVWSSIVQLNLPCAEPKVSPGDAHKSIRDSLAATSLMTHSARIFINRLVSLVRQQSSAPEPEDEDEVIVVGLPPSSSRRHIPTATAPLVITPIHILRAIRSGKEFDFLTNAGMATASPPTAVGKSGEP